MKVDKLCTNGIEKIVNQIPAILQVLQINQKWKGDQKYLTCILSDGYTKLKNCILIQDTLNVGQRPPAATPYCIVDITKCVKNEKVRKDQTTPSITLIIDSYTVLNDKVKKIIGQPMDYQDFLKNDKINQKGNNQIPVYTNENRNQKIHQNENSKLNYISSKEQSNINKQQAPSNKPINCKSKSNTNQTSISNTIPSHNVKTNNLSVKNQVKPMKNNYNSSSNTHSLNSNQNSISHQNRISPKPNKPSSPYNQIKQLYLGIDNVSVLIRVLFIIPSKIIKTRKGTESTIFSLIVGDQSGTIECVLFGQTANRYENVFKADQIYQIINFTVNENVFRNKRQLKMNFNDYTKLNIHEDRPEIPYIEDFCLTVANLTQLEIGQQCNIICLIKDTKQIVKFESKQGKPMEKKLVYLCDPQAQIQIQIILWNEKSHISFEKVPYAMKGIIVTEYNSNKQYATAINFTYRALKQHNLRKFIRQLDSINFSNPMQNNKKNRQAINNFQQLNLQTENLQEGKTVWSEVMCYLNAVRVGPGVKTTYMSCPNCKKKVDEQYDSKCMNCDHFYKKAKYRYFLSVNLTDSYDSIWATAYDEPAEIIMALGNQSVFEANNFIKLTQEECVERVAAIKMKQLKVKLVSKKQEYNGDLRLKSNVIKIMDLNFAQQSKVMIDKMNKKINK